jgi:hypothetical protein
VAAIMTHQKGGLKAANAANGSLRHRNSYHAEEEEGMSSTSIRRLRTVADRLPKGVSSNANRRDGSWSTQRSHAAVCSVATTTNMPCALLSSGL